MHVGDVVNAGPAPQWVREGLTQTESMPQYEQRVSSLCAGIDAPHRAILEAGWPCVARNVYEVDARLKPPFLI